MPTATEGKPDPCASRDRPANCLRLAVRFVMVTLPGSRSNLGIMNTQVAAMFRFGSMAFMLNAVAYLCSVCLCCLMVSERILLNGDSFVYARSPWV